MEQPLTNIVVTMTIPPVKYQAAAMDIMSQYGDVVQQALNETREKLMFDEIFQEEVKNVIKDKIDEVMRNAIKSAAENVAWDLFYRKDSNIHCLVERAIREALQPNGKEEK